MKIPERAKGHLSTELTCFRASKGRVELVLAVRSTCKVLESALLASNTAGPCHLAMRVCSEYKLLDGIVAPMKCGSRRLTVDPCHEE